MNELKVTPELVGKIVRNATRPEWGDGRVLAVKGGGQHEGRPAQRVQVHFARGGTRWLLSPPARLVTAGGEPTRQAGWIEQLGGASLDDRLRKLPEHAVNVLGGLRERLAAVARLYEFHEDPRSLQRWAIDQTGAGDPLSHWSRDELLAGFREFCVERDSHFRNLAAQLKMKEGPDALHELLASLPPEQREGINAALARVI